jgi:hypothetical protein
MPSAELRQKVKPGHIGKVVVDDQAAAVGQFGDPEHFVATRKSADLEAFDRERES